MSGSQPRSGAQPIPMRSRQRTNDSRSGAVAIPARGGRVPAGADDEFGGRIGGRSDAAAMSQSLPPRAPVIGSLPPPSDLGIGMPGLSLPDPSPGSSSFLETLKKQRADAPVVGSAPVFGGGRFLPGGGGPVGSLDDGPGLSSRVVPARGSSTVLGLLMAQPSGRAGASMDPETRAKAAAESRAAAARERELEAIAEADAGAFMAPVQRGSHRRVRGTGKGTGTGTGVGVGGSGGDPSLSGGQRAIAVGGARLGGPVVAGVGSGRIGVTATAGSPSGRGGGAASAGAAGASPAGTTASARGGVSGVASGSSSRGFGSRLLESAGAHEGDGSDEEDLLPPPE